MTATLALLILMRFLFVLIVFGTGMALMIWVTMWVVCWIEDHFNK